jgi:xylulose-5-phosphate/fructose-6-phosphate phosphoketolase
MRSYRPEELFDDKGAPVAELTAQAPKGARRMGANPIANGGRLRNDLIIPAWPDYAVEVKDPATKRLESTRKMGELMRDIMKRNEHQNNFRLFCPDETNSNRLGAVFEVTDRCLVERTIPTDDHVSPDGKVMEVLSEHNCHGWLEGYILTGRHGLFATYEAFAMVSASMTVQHAKWMDEAADLNWRRSISALNILLTSTCWRNDHNGFSHQGPGLIDVVMSKQGIVTRIYLPPDANSLLWVADHCFRSLNYVNLIVIDKQPQLQYMDADAALAHCSAGGGIWKWCSNEEHPEEGPDIVLGCAGDIPTMEIVAAAWLLQTHVPDLKVRVVNVVDLMRMAHPHAHPHGMSDVTFNEWFTPDVDVVFGFHGYPRAIHQLIHGRSSPNRFHVKGYSEEGTTTTPFDMVRLNGIDRYTLTMEALKWAKRQPAGAEELKDYCEDMLAKESRYMEDNLQDLPEITDWIWSKS